MWNPYSHMKAKCKKQYDDTVHINDLLLNRLTMFEYTNLPDTIPDWLLETILSTEGTAGICRMNDGQLYTGSGGFCGEIKNFLPTEYQITNAGIGHKQGKIGEIFAVGYNNSTLSPDFMLMQTASILTEIDVSERCNVLFSRLLRIPKVADEKEKSAIENCIKAVLDGKFEAVVSKNVLEKMIETGSVDNKFLDLCDIRDIDKLQYLNQYRDNVVKRFYQFYGQGMQTTSKLAQQTTDELHGYDAIAMIVPTDMLRRRKEMCEQINSMFNTNISVDFSECWRDSREEMQELYKDGNIDETATKESENNEQSDETV